jgi:predicted dehydrogenase
MTQEQDLDRPMHVVVVGYGYWGSKHVRVLSNVCGVSTAIAEPDEARRAAARRDFPQLPLASELGELADWADAIVVATPPRTHHALAGAAIEAGLDVLVEKPLATSVLECEQLITAAADAGVILMTGHTFEHSSAVWKLREIVASGQLGELCYIDTARLNLGLYQPDLNVVWDLAPHDVSIINFLLGRLPQTVSAWGGSHRRGGPEDVAHLQLDYGDDQLTAYVHVSWLDPCKVRRTTVVGSEKMVVFNDVAPTEPIRIYDSSVSVADREALSTGDCVSYHQGDIVSPRITVQEPLAVEDGHFVDCVRSRSTPRTDGESGLDVVRVIEAASLALEWGRAIPVQLDVTLGALEMVG